MNLKDISKDITFQEDIHQYKNKDGKILTSVTQFLSTFKEPFDPTGIIATMCAKRAGITKNEILQQWKDKNTTACDLGHNIHARIETYIKTGEIIKDEYEYAVKAFSNIKFKGKLESEIKIYSNKYSLAGTFDIAEKIKDKIIIHDIKTNSRFDIKSKYNNKFLYPLEELEENHLSSYSMQILIYVEMLKEHGFDARPGLLLHLNPETKIFNTYEVLPLHKEVKKLLNYYKKMQQW